MEKRKNAPLFNSKLFSCCYFKYLTDQQLNKPLRITVKTHEVLYYILTSSRNSIFKEDSALSETVLGKASWKMDLQYLFTSSTVKHS